MRTRTLWVVLAGLLVVESSQAVAAQPPARLFATDNPQHGWTQFPAAGYSEPVCGIVYRLNDTVTNGMPLGAVDTGCLDLETNGTFGYSTIFNSITPRGKFGLRTPVLALSVGGKTWASGGPLSKPTLVHVPAWLDFELGPQPAWANTANPIPVPGWAKSVGQSKYDIPAGRVFCHTPAIVRWTSPITGSIRVSGGLWAVRNLEKRVQRWQLRKNAEPLTGGEIGWSETCTSATPQSLATGTGGEAALQLAVRQGDRIDLGFDVAAVCGDHIGVDLKITAVGAGKTWDLAGDWSDTQNPNGVWTCLDDRGGPLYLFEQGRASQVQLPRKIHYWGHYPVADLEYETNAPVQLALRAWSPFLPGDLKSSTIPGIVLEAHLRNVTAEPQSGTIVMNFPGPTAGEVPAGTDYERSQTHGQFQGMEVRAPSVSYALGIVGQEKLRLGGDLGSDEQAWVRIAQSLPAPEPGQAGTSAAVDFSVPAGEEKVVRFILTWCAPDWKAGGHPMATTTNTFTHMYARFYPNPAQTAQLLAAGHESLLQRILAWQQVLYAEKQLPVWLRDALVNNLYMITEVGLWAQARPPLGDWVRPEDGLYGMVESPRDCPQVECIPCSFYGNIPLVYFFPELALSTLRAYKHYQWPDGQVVWAFGGPLGGRPPLEFSMPSRPYQVASSDVCMVEMVDKLWRRTGNDAVLEEFYDAVKRATIHTMNLRPEYGEKQVIAMPTGDKDNEWVEDVPICGLASHVGGIHLAQLRMMRRMAEKMRDADLVRQCDQWFDAGARAMEEHLWTGKYYRFYNELTSGQKSEIMMGCQLDGEWIARLHGLPGVFPPDRVQTTLATIAKGNADPQECPYGMRVFASADGSKVQGNFGGYLGREAGTYSAEGFMLGMTYLYHGQKDFGEDLIRRTLAYVMVHNGYTWDFPLSWQVDSGKRTYGSDYYQNMILWSSPAAFAGQDLSAPCKPGGLVDRILSAASK
ncbi:MAG: hypothetical protein GXX96_26140 [Planctomycetaceae bacterium]|nr:hypothetical protein [Planctomycetaceae bacterium]